jgi:hypothetical protein
MWLFKAQGAWQKAQGLLHPSPLLPFNFLFSPIVFVESILLLYKINLSEYD